MLGPDRTPIHPYILWEHLKELQKPTYMFSATGFKRKNVAELAVNFKKMSVGSFDLCHQVKKMKISSS